MLMILMGWNVLVDEMEGLVIDGFGLFMFDVDLIVVF